MGFIFLLINKPNDIIMNYDKKQKLYLTLMLISFLITILLTVSTFIFFPDLELQLLVSTIILITSFLFISNFKGKFDIAKTLVNYKKLDSNREEPIKLNKKILTENWISNVKNTGYKLYKNYADFSIFYKFEYVTNKSKRNKTMIVIVTIKGATKFDANSISESINEIGEEFYKKERFNNHIVLQFKNVKEYTNENVFEADQVLFKKQYNKNYIVIINILQNVNDSSAYYLHNKDYSPNRFYSYGIEEINKLIK